jgi:6-phosphogluconolactonase
MPASAPKDGRTVVYVSSAGSREILVLRLDRETGAVEPIDATPVPGGEGPSPISMPLAVSPDRCFLYAAVRSEPFPAASFAIDRQSGRLRPLASYPLPDAMAYIVTDRTGRYLLSASYHGSKLAINRIGREGAVEAPAVQVLATPPNAHCIVVDRTNRHVYATSLGGDLVMQLGFDAASGRITPADPSGVRSKPKAGPRHLAFAPDGRFLYLINELDGTVNAYEVDARSGALTERQTVALLPADFPAKPSAADLHITPDGRFLYGSERASNTIAGFAVDPLSGRLTPLGSVPTEPPPRGFRIDPRGRFLLAVGQNSNRMSVYSIDGSTGGLTRLAGYPMGANPNWVEIIDLP